MKQIKIYPDGACSPNPGKGGLGYVIIADGWGFTRGSKGFRSTTNNRMEILAATEGLRCAKEIIADIVKETRDTDIKVTVYSDSQTVVKTMNDGWSRNSNNDLWKQLDEAVDAVGGDVQFVWVKGHASNPFNNEADQLAVKARMNPTEIDEVYENIFKAPPVEKNPSLFDNIKETNEPSPVVVDVVLRGWNSRSGRSIEVVLSNGAGVQIRPLYGAFELCSGTESEKEAAMKILPRFAAWLNGEEN